MSSSNAIGGYFELEMGDHGYIYHDNAYAVNSGRNALELILNNIEIEKIFIPFYTCDVLLQPLKKLKIEYEFYKLDKHFNPIINSTDDKDWILYVNYFGVFTNKVKQLLDNYENMIIDNSQAFFAKAFNNNPTFYSPRKFFGVPDGGFTIIDKKIDYNFPIDLSFDRSSHLLKRADELTEQGYNDFKVNDSKLDELPIRKMSQFTKKLLRSIDYKKVKEIRDENFQLLHQHLRMDNELTEIIESNEINGPMVYPYLKKENEKLRSNLINHRIYVAQYWPNVINWIKDKNALEHYLFSNLIPLPIDQRYSKSEMLIILDKISRV